MKCFVITKKMCLLIILSFVLVASSVGLYFGIRSTSLQPSVYPTIVIDAGHGGIDGGAVGDITNVSESYLNLQFANCLKEICEDYGFNVVLTRKDMNGLYSVFSKNKKRSEMEKRKEIIKNANPDLVVSIHMNSFGLSSVCGSQVFYNPQSESGKALATSVQLALNKEIENAKSTPKVEDFYLLKCTDAPSILVECGFLSNPEEEKLLCDKVYQSKFCYTMFYGILNYFSME